MLDGGGQEVSAVGFEAVADQPEQDGVVALGGAAGEDDLLAAWRTRRRAATCSRARSTASLARWP